MQSKPIGYNSTPMTSVRLEHIIKRFGEAVALDDINLHIAAGELFFLLGPSGCGKSTLLRLIAGLHDPSSGKILFNDRDVTALGTESRNAVMCFQSYALWPHMTVRDNVRFGLDVRRLASRDAATRVEEVLKLVQMERYGNRRPSELSGGQQQRVALARALAVRPDCLLLDEPLSNLDATLRLQMRSEIRRICKQSGATTIYVTHDQKEALSVADRIAVMRDGHVIQVGSPGELYRRPANSFVASFLGQTNLITGHVAGGSDGDGVRIDTPIGPVTAVADEGIRRATGERIVLSIRPERVRISHGRPSSDTINRFSAEQTHETFLGDSSEHTVRVGDQELMVIGAPAAAPGAGKMTIEFDPADVVVLTE